MAPSGFIPLLRKCAGFYSNARDTAMYRATMTLHETLSIRAKSNNQHDE